MSALYLNGLITLADEGKTFEIDTVTGQAKFGDKILKDYVTVGGSTSRADHRILNTGTDHTILQAAFAQAVAENKDVKILGGVNIQLVNGSVTHPANVNLIGMGKKSKITISTGQKYTVTNSNLPANITIEDVYFDSLGQTSEIGGDRAIEVYNVTNVDFKHIYGDFNIFGFYILTTGVSSKTGDIRIIDSELYGRGKQDIVGGGKLLPSYTQPYNITVQNCKVYQDVTGIKYYKSLSNGNVGNALTNATFWEEVTIPKTASYNSTVSYTLNALVGDKYQGAISLVGVDNFRIINCDTKGVTIAGFEATPNSNILFSGNIVKPCIGGGQTEFGVIATTGFGYDAATYVGDDIKIINNTITDGLINVFCGVPTSRFKEVKIMGNTVKCNVPFFDDNIPYGIRIERADGAIVIGNSISGTVTNLLPNAVNIRGCINSTSHSNKLEYCTNGDVQTTVSATNKMGTNAITDFRSITMYNNVVTPYLEN